MRLLLTCVALSGALSAGACNWIAPRCATNTDCPAFSYCNPTDKVCFDCPYDGTSVVLDAGIVECAFSDGGTGSDT